MSFEIMSGRKQFSVGGYLAEYARHMASATGARCYLYSTEQLINAVRARRRHWDGLSADQARRLAAELQRSVEDCSIDAYARQLFKRSVPSWVASDYECERRFVNQFIAEAERFIAFLLTCDGFEIR
jgi:hypothetical protein